MENSPSKLSNSPFLYYVADFSFISLWMFGTNFLINLQPLGLGLLIRNCQLNNYLVSHCVLGLHSRRNPLIITSITLLPTLLTKMNSFSTVVSSILMFNCLKLRHWTVFFSVDATWCASQRQWQLLIPLFLICWKQLTSQVCKKDFKALTFLSIPDTYETIKDDERADMSSKSYSGHMHQSKAFYKAIGLRKEVAFV